MASVTLLATNCFAQDMEKLRMSDEFAIICATNMVSAQLGDGQAVASKPAKNADKVVTIFFREAAVHVASRKLSIYKFDKMLSTGNTLYKLEDTSEIRMNPVATSLTGSFLLDTKMTGGSKLVLTMRGECKEVSKQEAVKIVTSIVK